MGYLNDGMKRMDIIDMGMIKATVLLFTLFLITIWPALNDWVHSVNPWYFFVAGLIVVARPFYRFYIKR